jgi:hypothetical protein
MNLSNFSDLAHMIMLQASAGWQVVRLTWGCWGNLCIFGATHVLQGFTPIPPEARVLQPGDLLTLQCTFDSTERTNVTLGGFGTREEVGLPLGLEWDGSAQHMCCAGGAFVRVLHPHM